MSGEMELRKLLRGMTPRLNPGTFVFVTTKNPEKIDRSDIIGEFKEEEGTTLILKKEHADKHGFSYDFEAAWITLTIHSALDAVGLTAAFSSELTNHGISCNVIAGYYHDHIFVDHKDKEKAMEVLRTLSKGNT